MKKDIKKYIEIPQKILFLVILFLLISRDRSHSREVLMIILCGSIILEKIFFKENFKKISKKIGVSIVVYSLFLLISYLKIIKVERHFFDLKVILLYYIVFPFLVYQLNFEEKFFKIILLITMISSSIVIFKGIEFIKETPNFFKYYPRLEIWNILATGSGIIIGMYLFINLLICFYLKNIYIKIFASILILGQLLMMLLCQTRSIFLFLPITLIILLLLVIYKKKNILKLKRKYYLILLTIIPIYFILKKYLPSFYTRLSLKKMLHNERFLVYKHGITSLENKDIIFGKGFFYNLGGKIKIDGIVPLSEYHNLYLEVLVTQGIIATLSLFFFMIISLKKLILKFLETTSSIKECILLIAIGLLILFNIIGLVESTIYMSHLGRIVFLYVALAFGIDGDKKNEEKNINNDK